MKMRMQDQFSLLGVILTLTACGVSPERSEASADTGQAGAEQGAVVTQEAAVADTPATTPPSTAPANAAPADAAAEMQPVAVDTAASGQRPSGQRPAGSQRDSAIFTAAGLHFAQARGQWESGACGDPPMGAYEPGAISKVEDLNGDGRPEALVTEGGTCYGNIGVRFWLLSQQPGGQWTIMTDSIAIPAFLATKGVDGFPDIQGGGPGFCFPVARWNGREYTLNRHEYEGKPCSPSR